MHCFWFPPLAWSHEWFFSYKQPTCRLIWAKYLIMISRLHPRDMFLYHKCTKVSECVSDNENNILLMGHTVWCPIAGVIGQRPHHPTEGHWDVLDISHPKSLDCNSLHGHVSWSLYENCARRLWLGSSGRLGTVGQSCSWMRNESRGSVHVY